MEAIAKKMAVKTDITASGHAKLNKLKDGPVTATTYDESGRFSVYTESQTATIMPTATEYLGYSVINLGPLTTTFTAAPSCATSLDYKWIASQHQGDSEPQIYGYPTCGAPKFEGCIPNGKEFDSRLAELSATPHNGNVMYRSPGIHCPSGWTTAGTIVGGGASGRSASGVFTQFQSDDDGSDGGVRHVSMIEAFVKPLQESETMAWCCPSGWKANAAAFCSSSLGPLSHSYSEVCLAIIPSNDIATVTSFQGASLTQPVVLITGTDTSYETRTRKIDPSDASGLTVVTAGPVVALVYQSSDKGQHGSHGSTGASGKSGTATGGDSKDASSAFRPSLLGIAMGALVATLLGTGQLI
ncbi:pyruvate formate lyase activating enzyme [Purpureocillium lavendulum]|uniref:Pyruvate formate lyase activating enzyme n=1 Tax=Purpureocillium lavendulum TaxID=1247861 RepID=A0AB34G3V1_9HYPO|nr:pyruvate formate lyase activating enzyme [Purpureocillium lavendulum]